MIALRWKILVTICLISGSRIPLTAQLLTATIHVDSVLSSHIFEWNEYNTIILKVHNSTDSACTFKLESTILSQGKALISAPLGLTRTFSIGPSSDMVVATKDIFPVQTLHYIDKKHKDTRRGIVPVGGDISICINLFDVTGLRGLARANCVHRMIEPYQAAVPRAPGRGDTLDIRTSVHFEWSGVKPVPRHCHYALRVFSVDGEQYLSQVPRTHRALLDTIIVDRSTFDWRCPDSLQSKQLAWQIRSTNGEAMPYGGMDGYSNIEVFHLANAVRTGLLKSTVPGDSVKKKRQVRRVKSKN